MRRRPIVGGLVALAAVALVGGAVASGAVPGGSLFGTATVSLDPAASPAAAGSTVETAAIVERTMAATEDLDGTLGYDGDMTVVAGSGGTLTWLPAPGSVIKRGGRLFELDGRRHPVLFLGIRPLWRTLEAGMTDGLDVKALETNLKALGHAPSGMKVDRHWDAKTTFAVKRWEKATGQVRDGIIELGDVIVLPAALRVRETAASVGSMIGPGMPILSATGVTKVVTVELTATKRDRLVVGAAVTITLPDDTQIDGTVRTVGRVATAGQQGESATIPVTIALADPTAAPDLDEAPVTVQVTTESHPDVLAVPVDALVALLEGGYAVEVVDDAGARRYVGVTLGLFEDNLVEISGSGLEAGDRVVVPA
jgi:peptidoglycan hydrolase-like protein with peptidoglycan-binding domain